MFDFVYYAGAILEIQYIYGGDKSVRDFIYYALAPQILPFDLVLLE